MSSPERLDGVSPYQNGVPSSCPPPNGSTEPRELRQRKHPAKGVFIFRGHATIVFVTVCSHNREKQLANPAVHDALLRAWKKADRWMIGAYVIMPDHIHLFCSPIDETVAIEKWITFWKREFRRILGPSSPRFQIDGFHHRLRGEDSYAEKWDYVQANPVRAGLVPNSDDWPYQGVLSELRS